VRQEEDDMSAATIRAAYSMWPQYNRRLREVIAAMSDEHLAIRPSAERWPLWATVGHTACQRVFWLCDFAGALRKQAFHGFVESGSYRFSRRSLPWMPSA
jgi:hypothetical protein